MTTEAKVPEATMKPLDEILLEMAKAGENLENRPWETLSKAAQEAQIQGMRRALLAAQDAGASLQPNEATMEQVNIGYKLVGTSIALHRFTPLWRAMTAASPYRIERGKMNHDG